MKDKINPTVATIFVVIALLIIGFVFYKQTTPPGPMKADPMGGDDVKSNKSVTPDVQEAIKRSRQMNGNQEK